MSSSIEAPIRVVYITGAMRSGTTLLQRVIGAHPDALSVGGFKWFPKALGGKIKCSCGSEALACPHWARVVDAVCDPKGPERGNTGTPVGVLTDLDYRAFSALQDLTGRSVIVDSSRNTARMRRLLADPRLETLVVHIFKSPPAHLSSHKRKGRSLANAIRRYWVEHLAAMLSTFRGSNNPITIQYERFTQDPKRVLRGIYRALELDASDEIIDTILASWGQADAHTFGGNRMRKIASSAIITDESWRSRLTPTEVHLSRILCAIPYGFCRARARRTGRTSTPVLIRCQSRWLSPFRAGGTQLPAPMTIAFADEHGNLQGNEPIAAVYQTPPSVDDGVKP